MKSRSGFTIVELLIVIVVIGILAAIVIVTYNGVQNRALASALASETSSATKKIELFRVTNDVYPTSISACPTPNATELCIPFSGDRELDYQSSVDANGTASYAISLQTDSQFLYTSNAEKTSGGNEFMKYVDLAPYIDRYGLEKYEVSFDAKSADPSTDDSTQIYFQNGSGSRYTGLHETFTVTTEYQHYSYEWTPENSNMSYSEAWLAFYGTYNTGNRPIVKNVQVRLAT